DGLLYGRHVTPPLRFQGPRGLYCRLWCHPGSEITLWFQAANLEESWPRFSPIDRDCASFCQTCSKRSISVSVVVAPRLIRIAPRASSDPIPMAARTCEGATLPEEQAEPEDTAKPSRSKSITRVSALPPGTATR